jgi:hypothetical protein
MLKKIVTGSALALALIAGAAFPVLAATPQWNATGSYVVNMEYLGNQYPHDMVLTQDAAGNLTGHGGSPAGANTYMWTITSGTVDGNTIDFLANYTATADAVTPQTVLHVTGTIAPNGTISGTWSDNYQGGARSGALTTVSGSASALGTLAAEDFGVMNFSNVKGYTAGFGLTDATFEDVQSVVINLYSGSTLLQTNTATAKVGDEITGNQISSPFDVFGTFDYAADGYWVNTRGTEYGQNLIPTRVVATVTLENGKVVTAENTNLTGDTSEIFPDTETLTVVKAGTGSGTVMSVGTGINCGADCSEEYAYGTDVTLNATATTGSTFTGWSGACTGTGSCVLDMTAAKTVTATFTLNNPTPNPSDKNACKDGGWKTMTNPTFKNQGQCVSYMNHQ